MKIPHLINKKTILAFLTVGLLATVSGCTATEEDVVPAKTDEYISYKVNGKEYSDNNPTSLGDEDYFDLYSSVALNNSFNSPAYLLNLSLSKSKIGTFTVQNSSLSGDISLIKSLSDVDGYDIPDKGTGTLTLSQFDPKGYAEGTFSFVARNSKGQTMTVSDGKFRMDLR